MSLAASLDGGCCCGRNKYIVLIPADANEVAQVFFDNSHLHRRSQATPLSAWLRVPLAWHQSTTFAFFDDEMPSSIRRLYTPPDEQNAKRHFCGFCGTPLSYWTESPAGEAEYISLTLGSLSTDKLRNLEDMGLLPKEFSAAEEKGGASEPSQNDSTVSQRQHQGLPWFDTLVEGSKLGNMKLSMGSNKRRNGNVRVEWEIMEWTEGAEGESPPAPSAKRKLGDLGAEDSTMEESR